jgi:probable rRNA maturation factor
MATVIDLQNDSGLESVPAEARFQQWVDAALQTSYPRLEQTICVVGEAESRELNRRFRDRDSATNVLAFPGDNELLDYDCLGDLVICAPLVLAEAEAQGKAIEAHWAHLVVHGMLHLQGFDHQDEQQADSMESLEVEILDTLGYANPYND